jgi:hypothetical protein
MLTALLIVAVIVELVLIFGLRLRLAVLSSAIPSSALCAIVPWRVRRLMRIASPKTSHPLFAKFNRPALHHIAALHGH